MLDYFQFLVSNFRIQDAAEPRTIMDRLFISISRYLLSISLKSNATYFT